MNLNQLEKVISSDMSGNQFLFTTKNRMGDTYINNGLIISSLSVEKTNENGKRQVRTGVKF